VSIFLPRYSAKSDRIVHTLDRDYLFSILLVRVGVFEIGTCMAKISPQRSTLPISTSPSQSLSLIMSIEEFTEKSCSSLALLEEKF
jgi:hypothetical protein